MWPLLYYTTKIVEEIQTLLCKREKCNFTKKNKEAKKKNTMFYTYLETHL